MTTAILVAGGAGTRLGGGTPKAFRELCGKPLLCYALEAIAACDSLDAVVIVTPADYLSQAHNWVANSDCRMPATVVAGGAQRTDSVLAGLVATGNDCEWVAVHDAARPFASASLFQEVIAAAKTHGGAIAARRATDTVKRATESQITETLDRNQIWLAETPQVFRRSDLLEALHQAQNRGQNPTDEAQAMEWIGLSPYLLESSAPNIKITTPADWALAEQLLECPSS